MTFINNVVIIIILVDLFSCNLLSLSSIANSIMIITVCHTMRKLLCDKKKYPSTLILLGVLKLYTVFYQFRLNKLML